MSDNLPAKVEGNEIAPAQPQPLELLSQALQSGVDAESIALLVKLANENEDRAAVREFNAGMRQFHQDVPAILKTKSSQEAGRSGSKFAFKYAPLDMIDRTVRPILSTLGFTYRWNSELTDDGKMKVTCVLSHINGHKEESVFVCPTDSASPSMTGQMRHGSAETFGRRYSLTSVLGLTTVDEDSGGVDPTPVNVEQAATIEEMIDSAAEASGRDRAAVEARFLVYLGVDSVAAIPAEDYARALTSLRAVGAK